MNINFGVVGVTFDGRQEILRGLRGRKIRDGLVLLRQFDNPYDKDAVAVTVDGVVVGYVPRNVNRLVFQTRGLLKSKELDVYWSGRLGRYCANLNLEYDDKQDIFEKFRECMQR